MKPKYDFSRARRGPIAPPAAGKTRITIRLDDAMPSLIFFVLVNGQMPSS